MLQPLYKIQTNEKPPLNCLYQRSLGMLQSEIEQAEDPRIPNSTAFSPDDEHSNEDMWISAQSLNMPQELREYRGPEMPGKNEIDPEILELHETQILLEAHDYRLLSMEQTIELKEMLRQGAERMQILSRRLGVQRRLREAAHVVLQECEDNETITRMAQKQLNDANHQIDAIATELWGLTQSSNEIRSQLQQHAVKVLLEVSKFRSNNEREETEAVRMQQQAVTNRLVADLEAEITELRRELARTGS